MRTRLCTTVLMGLLTTACVSGTSANLGSGTAGPVVVVTSGGPIGAACATEDLIGCALGSKGKVRCQSGLWVDDGACAQGETCIESKVDGVVSATQCGVPPTLRDQRAVLCAKASACGGKVDFDKCMNPMTQTMINKSIAVSGLIGPQDLLVQGLEAFASCLKNATDCSAVETCLAGSVPACESNSADSCVGSVARMCSGGSTYSADCGKVGLPCTKVSSGILSVLFCGAAPSCSNPGAVTCSGNVAKSCVAISADTAFETKVDCAGLGGTCNPAGGASLSQYNVCVFGGGAPCDKASFLGKCSGSVATNCVNGKTVAIDCGLALATCEEQTTGSGKGEADCTYTPNCQTALVQDCADGMVKFCDGASGVRGFSCAKAGLKCESGQCRF